MIATATRSCARQWSPRPAARWLANARNALARAALIPFVRLQSSRAPASILVVLAGLIALQLANAGVVAARMGHSQAVSAPAFVPTPRDPRLPHLRPVPVR